MPHYLDQLLTPEQRAACKAADDADACARHPQPPYWPFAPLTAQQARAHRHPLSAARPAAARGPGAGVHAAIAEAASAGARP